MDILPRNGAIRCNRCRKVFFFRFIRESSLCLSSRKIRRRPCFQGNRTLLGLEGGWLLGMIGMMTTMQLLVKKSGRQIMRWSLSLVEMICTLKHWILNYLELNEK